MGYLLSSLTPFILILTSTPLPTYATTPAPHHSINISDKFLGSVALGAWGDALGAPTEEGGYALNVSSETLWGGENLKPFPNRPWSDSAWGTWPPMDEITGNLGVFTDDTSVHVTILQPWLLSLKSVSELTEDSLWEYMNTTESSLWATESAAGSSVSQLDKRRRLMLSDYLAMYYTANSTRFPKTPGVSRANQTFWQQGYPACFGTYMFLELAAALPLHPDAIFRLFSGQIFGVLDQGYGRIVTATQAVLSRMAVDVKPQRTTNYLSGHVKETPQTGEVKNFASFFFNGLKYVFSNCEAGTLDCNSFGPMLTSAVDTALVLGAEWASSGYNESQVLTLYKDIVVPGIRPGPYQVSDPLVFLREQCIALSYCSATMSDVLCPFRLLHLWPGDTDTVSSQLAQIFGAYAGYESLGKLRTTDGSLFSKQFKELEEYLIGLYHIPSFVHGINALLHVRNLVDDAETL